MPQLILFLILIISVRSNQQANINKLTLSRIEDNKYALKIVIGNQKANIQAHLSDELDWLKEDDCVICQDSSQTCTQSCSQDDKQKGITCTKSYCKNTKNQQDKQKSQKQKYPYYISEAKKVQLKVKQQPKNRKIAYKTLLVKKMIQKMDEVGRINLFNGPEGFFGEEVLIVKNHGKDLSVFYYEGQYQQKLSQPLYKQIPIIKQGQNAIGLSLEATLKGQEVKKDKKQDKKDNPEELQQKQVNIYDITCIKLKDQVNYKEKKGNLKGNENNKNEQNKSLYLSEIILTKTTVQFSIKTNKLILPPNVYKKLTQEIINKYFNSSTSKQQHQKDKTQSSNKGKEKQKQDSQQDQSDEKSQQQQKRKNSKVKQCQFNMNILSCPSKQFINLQKLDNITISLIVNNIQIQFPIRSIVQSCGQDQCTFLLDISKDKKQVIIGDFILNIFALHYKSKQNKIVLYRLKNQWANNFLPSDERKIGYYQVNFIIMLLWFVMNAIKIVVEVIGIFAVIVLVLNCVYHWRQVLEWLTKILQKISKKDMQIDEKKQSKIGIIQKKIKKMSKNIKNRFQKVFRKQKRNYSQLFHVKIKQLQQQQLTQVQDKKLINVDELMDNSQDNCSNREEQDQDLNIIKESRKQMNKQSGKEKIDVKQLFNRFNKQKVHPYIVEKITQQNHNIQYKQQKQRQKQKQKQKQNKSQKQQKQRQEKSQSKQVEQNKRNEFEEQFYEFQHTSFQHSYQGF